MLIGLQRKARRCAAVLVVSLMVCVSGCMWSYRRELTFNGATSAAMGDQHTLLAITRDVASQFGFRERADEDFVRSRAALMRGENPIRVLGEFVNRDEQVTIAIAVKDKEGRVFINITDAPFASSRAFSDALESAMDREIATRLPKLRMTINRGWAAHM